MFEKIFIVFVVVFVCVSSVDAADYSWPTDASRYLTSSFAEYRTGHFHAGVDVKTWGQEGYRVFAVRDGYISRIGVSPFGYGKVLYQTLDTGEIAVYAHLKGFNDTIESLIRREQKKVGEYRVNIYLSKMDIPVEQGDVIGYTGSSGIGHPHLHFEIRDAKNHPLNPMLRGYTVEDQIAPTIKSIAVIPLDAESRVNRDVKSLLVKPKLIERAEYEITEPLLIYGNIGIAVDCYDSANDVSNSYAVYTAELYVDGERVFRAQYDTFSYDVSGLIDLDRDFRLATRKIGLYQKLYIEENNTLPFYTPSNPGTGILRCRMDASERSGRGKLYLPGFHSFRIEVADFNGNVSCAHGEFWIGKSYSITSEYFTNEKGQIVLTGFYDEKGKTITNPHVFYTTDVGLSWHKKNWIFEGTPFVFEHNSTEYPQAWKIITMNEYGVGSNPDYLLSRSSGNKKANDTLTLALIEDFYDDFIRFEVTVSEPVLNQPVLIVQQNGATSVDVELVQNSLTGYSGVYNLKPSYDGLMRVDLSAMSNAGDTVAYVKNIYLSTVTPEKGGEIKSWDNTCEVIFKTNSVYRTMYARIEEHPEISTDGYDRVGIVYTIAPHDVPLKRNATVRLRYPVSDTLSDKLGIFGNVSGDKWSFIGAQRDHESRTISAQLGGLRNVTVIRDSVPPLVSIISPTNEGVTTGLPLLKALVKDELSGIASERSITMTLDGNKVIAEYDPETDLIFYQCEEALSSGKHELRVVASDNLKNSTERLHIFYVR